MSERTDVTVVGGGPAGAATAIALARAGRSVIVLERSHYDQIRIGETLPPVARVPLTNLDAWDRFVKQGHAPSPATTSAWGSENIGENHFIFNPYGNGWHLDRQRFDEMLASVAAQYGASLRLGSRMTACRAAGHSNGWEVEYAYGRSLRRLRTKFLIDATGRTSLLARRLGARRIRFDGLVGIAGMLSASSNEVADYRTLVEAAENGWWYAALLPQARMIAVYMTDADLLPKGPQRLEAHWRARLKKTTHIRSRVRGLTLQASLRLLPAASEILDHIEGHHWLAVGDAAVSVDPLSSQGIYQALKSGLLAARAIDECWGRRSTSLSELSLRTRESFYLYWEKRWTYYSQEKRWPDSVFWRRRHGEKERARPKVQCESL